MRDQPGALAQQVLNADSAAVFLEPEVGQAAPEECIQDFGSCIIPLFADFGLGINLEEPAGD